MKRIRLIDKNGTNQLNMLTDRVPVRGDRIQYYMDQYHVLQVVLMANPNVSAREFVATVYVHGVADPL